MSPEGNGPLESRPETADPTPDRAPDAGHAAEPYLGLGTWEWDPLSGKLWWSEPVYRIFGVDRTTFDPSLDKVIAMALDEDRWVHEVDITEWPLAPYSIYFRIRRADGSIRTLRETGGPSPSATAANPRVIGTVLDVTDIEADAENGVAAEIGTWRWDSTSAELRASPEALQILGLRPDGMICQEERNLLLHPEDRDRVARVYEEARRARSGFHHRYRILRPNGEVRFIEEDGHPREPGVFESRITDITDRTRLERNLMRAQKIARLGTWEFDPRTGVLWWSDQTYRLLGFEPGEIRPSMTIWESRIHPDDVRSMRTALDEAIRTQRPYSLQYRIRLPDGSMRFLIDQGEFSDGIEVGLVMDITEHHRAERNLNLAQQIAQIGSWEWSLTSDDHWCSEQCYRILGLDPRTDVLDEAVWDRITHPDDAARTSAYLADALSNRRSYTYQYRLIRPDGMERIVVESAEPLSDDRYVGTLVDVTDRVRMERNLAEAQRIAGLGSWEVDGRSGEIRWSEEMYRLLGAAPNLVPPSVEFWGAHIHLEDRGRVLAAYEEAARSHTPYSLQYRLIRSDNQTRYVHEQCECADGGFAGYVMDITDRQKIQRRLAKAQEIARIGSWEWDPATNRTWLSDEVYRMLGLDPATWEFEIDRWYGLIHPEDRDRVRQAYATADARSEGCAIQLQIRQPDGGYRLYYEQSEPNDAGTYTGILWDITDMTRAQRNMAEAQRIARIGSWEWDVDRDEHWWSDECYRILGLDPQTVAATELTWDALTHPDDVAWTEVEFQEAIRTHRPYSYQYRIIRPDGQVCTVFETGEPVSTDRYAGTVMDVSERVKIESRLAESQRLAKLGSWEWNTETDERWWSEECYRLYGISPEVRPITRQIWLSSIHPDDMPALRSLIASVEAHPRPYNYRCRVRRPDGSLRTIQVHGEPISDYGPGNPIIAGTTLDITDRESIENQLHQAQKMEAVGQLTGGIAHDFNNLLGAILGNLDLLNDEIASPHAKGLVNRAVSAAESGAQLVRRLLAFSRKQALDAQVTDVNELIVNVLDLLRRTLGDKVQIETDLAAGPIHCLIDRPQTEGALLNLCINARDAMPDGGTVTIGTREVTFDARRPGFPDLRPGPHIELTVTDDGTGMLHEVMERAFEPFFTTKAAGQGSGLGLSMVYGFVKQSDGHVEIASRPNHGTTVRIYLPLYTGGIPRPVDADPPAPTPSRGKELILVVEDNADLRSYAVGVLRSFGYRALSASCASGALKLLESRADVALLFTDIVFKEGPTGIQLAEMARRQRPDLKVLLTSGYLGDRAVRDRAGEAGTFTIAKPFRAPELGRKLEEIFGPGAPRHSLY